MIDKFTLLKASEYISHSLPPRILTETTYIEKTLHGVQMTLNVVEINYAILDTNCLLIKLPANTRIKL